MNKPGVGSHKHPLSLGWPGPQQWPFINNGPAFDGSTPCARRWAKHFTYDFIPPHNNPMMWAIVIL